MIKKKLFLASSNELAEDRKEFEILIGRKNKDWVDKGVSLELIVWEDFLDSMSRTRLQDEYNKAIRECDIFVMLFWTKVGRYTEEEFQTAFGAFKSANTPLIFTYFKDAPSSKGGVSDEDAKSLEAFMQTLDGLGHFYTRYAHLDTLKLHFSQQLDKLAANGFVEFTPDRHDTATPANTTYKATAQDSAAIAQGKGATAVAAGGVVVAGDNNSDINTGTSIKVGTINAGARNINTGGGAYVTGSVQAGGDFIGRDKIVHGASPSEMEPLFAPLLAAIAAHAPADQQTAAVEHINALKAEAAKGKDADDDKMGRIVDGLVKMVPGAVASVVSLFAHPVLKGVAGPVTNFVLDKLKSE